MVSMEEYVSMSVRLAKAEAWLEETEQQLATIKDAIEATQEHSDERGDGYFKAETILKIVGLA